MARTIQAPSARRRKPSARKKYSGFMVHYSAAFTLDKYGHVVDEMRKASSERMQKLIESMSM